MSTDEQILFSINSIIRRAQVTGDVKLLVAGFRALRTAKVEMAQRVRKGDDFEAGRDQTLSH